MNFSLSSGCQSFRSKMPFLCGPKTIVASKMLITHMEREKHRDYCRKWPHSGWQGFAFQQSCNGYQPSTQITMQNMSSPQLQGFPTLIRFVASTRSAWQRQAAAGLVPWWADGSRDRKAGDQGDVHDPVGRRSQSRIENMIVVNSA